MQAPFFDSFSMAMSAAVLAVAAALYGFPILLIPNHAPYSKPHKSADNYPHNKSSHFSKPPSAFSVFSSGSYLAAAIPFTPIFSVPLSLYGRTSR